MLRSQLSCLICNRREHRNQKSRQNGRAVDAWAKFLLHLHVAFCEAMKLRLPIRRMQHRMEQTCIRHACMHSCMLVKWRHICTSVHVTYSTPVQIDELQHAVALVAG